MVILEYNKQIKGKIQNSFSYDFPQKRIYFDFPMYERDWKYFSSIEFCLGKFRFLVTKFLYIHVQFNFEKLNWSSSKSTHKIYYRENNLILCCVLRIPVKIGKCVILKCHFLLHKLCVSFFPFSFSNKKK